MLLSGRVSPIRYGDFPPSHVRLRGAFNVLSGAGRFPLLGGSLLSEGPPVLVARIP